MKLVIGRTVGVFGLLVLAPGVANAEQSAGPTFSKDVAPIFFKNCVSCHRPGEVAPMSLTSYEQIRPWARAIRKKVVTREMPPWHADPAYGTFANDRRLTQHEIDTLLAWIDAGAPQGNPADLPQLPTFAEGWHGDREPDVVFKMPTFHVPAEGEIPYMNFYVKNTLPEDKFLEAIEMRPGNPSVVHHGRIDVVEIPEDCHVDEHGILLAADGRACPDDVGGVSDVPIDSGVRYFLVAFVPGHSYEHYRPGNGKRLSKGLWVRFNIHYQVTGVAMNDVTRVGIWYSRVPVTHEIFTRSVGDTLPTDDTDDTNYIVDGEDYVLSKVKVDENSAKQLAEGNGTIACTSCTKILPNIPPYADNWKIASVTAVTEAITVYDFWPHMHLRGKDMKWIVTWPDGREETILSVPKYDFNWQLQYELKEPLRLPAGSKVTGIGHYDNSVKNRYNPAPNKEVFWAEQSWDEMFAPFMEYTVDSLTVKPKNASR
jgi:hypothetical protein